MNNFKQSEHTDGSENTKNRSLRSTPGFFDHHLDQNKSILDPNAKKCQSPKYQDEGLNVSWSSHKPNFQFLPHKKWQSPVIKINPTIPTQTPSNQNSNFKLINQAQFNKHNPLQLQKQTKKIFEMVGEQQSPERKSINGPIKSYKTFHSKGNLNRTQQQHGRSKNNNQIPLLYTSPQKQLKIQCILNNIKKREKNISVQKESQISTAISSHSQLKNQSNDYNTLSKHPIIKTYTKHEEDVQKNKFTKVNKDQSTQRIHFFNPSPKPEDFQQKQQKISILTLSRTPTSLSINMQAQDKDQSKEIINRTNNKLTQQDHQNQHQFITYQQFSKNFHGALQRRHTTNHPFQFLKGSTILKITDFKIGKLIGKGKFGQVHMAMHKITSFLVAIKCIHKCHIKQYHMEKQLLQEIKLQSFSKHSNIVNLYGIIHDGDCLYLILEYMEGGTLFEALQIHKKIAQHEAVFFLKQIVQAVEYLHKHNIAHRDIKPENIVFNLGTAKLCDFGWSARVFDKRKTYCGTLDYFPPEILERKQYNEAVDLWCLGILMYQVLIGRVPFEMNEKSSSIHRIINVDKQKLYFPSYISNNAKDVISKLLKKKQEQRIKASDLLHHQFFQQISQ